MKTKTIKSILNRKFESFLKSIEDDDVKEAVRKDTIITGGCITSILLNEEVNDYDIYFTNLDTLVKVANYYVKKFNEVNKPDIVPFVVEKDGRVTITVKSSGIAFESEEEQDYQYFETLDPNDPRTSEFQEQILEVFKTSKRDKSKKYRPICMTSNAITLSDKIQLISRFYGEPEEIFKNYDFVHCTNYWLSSDRELHLNEKALTSILEKDLKYMGSLYPICSIFRIRKFIQRGWTISAGQLFKIIYQVADLDLKDPKILQDQLTGVDVAYFIEILGILQKEQDVDRIDYTYIANIVDLVF